jgi:hypothetical protein
MKKVLVISYSFPPLLNKESARVAEFVEQLGKYGWEPLVLTRGVRSGRNASSNELPAPEGINVVRSGPWAPDNLPRFIRVFARFFASLLIPDKERLWELFCIRKAARIAKYEGIDLIYTLSPPYSAHLIGLRLKKKHPGVPWVADVCPSPAAAGGGKMKERFIKALMGKIIREADCLVTGDKKLHDNMMSVLPGQAGEDAIFHIPDGRTQELSEQFERACRAMVARKIGKSGNT